MKEDSWVSASIPFQSTIITQTYCLPIQSPAYMRLSELLE